MASWYVGSVQYAAIAQFAISTAYAVGQIVRQLAAPAVGNERAFRCTTAGTSAGSEPSWTLTEGGTTSTGSAVFTECTGNSTYGWSAASARLHLILHSWAAPGDTTYVAENHAETQSSAIITTGFTAGTTASLILCVNSSGSVPPVAADLRTTATISTTGASAISYSGLIYFYGITLSAGSGSSAANITLSGAGQRWDNCAFIFNSTSASSRLVTGNAAAQNIVLNNCPITFGATTQGILKQAGFFTWKNTPTAINGSVPTSLFLGTSDSGNIYLDAVDLSAAGSGKTIVAALTVPTNVTIVNCKLGASVTYAASPTARLGIADLVISDSTSSTSRQERYACEGTLTRESTIVRSGGASDGVAAMSWKIVTTSLSTWVYPFRSFPIGIWNTSTGASLTATVEIINDGLTLTDADVWIEFETLDSSGTPLATLHTTSSATLLTAGSSLTTSSVTWTTTGISSPVKQKITSTFTPQLAGYIRASVCVARASTTLYVDPLLTVA